MTLVYIDKIPVSFILVSLTFDPGYYILNIYTL